jgi:hypothetical protein
MKVATIVEGDGEVAAVPLLLRRVAEWRTPEVFPETLVPIRVRRDRFLNRDEEFQRYLRLAAAKCKDGGWILVLLDADDDCPVQLAQQVLTRAAACVAHCKVSVVFATREFEAWFIAAAASLDGHRGFAFNPGETMGAEALRDAKGWLRQRMAGGTYGETTDQPSFAARFDLQQAFDGSRSFRKLCSEWDRQTTAA